MVFLIQNTQNRDSKAVHLKLDELIRALTGARNDLVDLEELSDEDLKKIEQGIQATEREGFPRPGGQVEEVLKKIIILSSSRRSYSGANKNFPARTKSENFAAMTIRPSREATAAPVPDEPVTPVCPMLAWHKFHQILFDFSGSLCFVRRNRSDKRITCVSTTMPSSTPNAFPSTTFAVLRPTPGSSRSCAMVLGTLPPYFFRQPLWQRPECFLFCCEKSGGLNRTLKCCLRCTREIGSCLVFAKSAGVTMFTRLSVHCAERIVATNNCSGFLKFSSQCAPG